MKVDGGGNRPSAPLESRAGIGEKQAERGGARRATQAMRKAWGIRVVCVHEVGNEAY
jgi:hypothetical protein